MFQDNGPLAGVVPLRRGNGSMSTGGALAVALERVAAAEAALAEARSAAKAAARREGRGVKKLFGESVFVSRASAERWIDEARAEGKNDGIKYLANVIERAHAPPDPNEDFYHVKMLLRREGNAVLGRLKGGLNSGRPKLSDVDLEQEQIRARQRPDLSRNAQIGAPTNSEDLARGILKAAERSKSPTGTADPELPTTPLSRAIISAGKKRRGDDR